VAWYSSCAGTIAGVVSLGSKTTSLSLCLPGHHNAAQKPGKGAGKGKKKASIWRLLALIFRFFSYAQSPPESGAKVKKEAENSSIHACSYLFSQV
jgi:hypothetical protein